LNGNKLRTQVTDWYAGDQCLEFVPVLAATTYLDPAVRPASHKLSFDVVDFVPDQEGKTGLYAAIYPTSSAQIYSADFNGAGAPTPEATAAIARVNVTNHPGPDPDDPNKAVLTYSRLADEAPYKHRFLAQSSVDRLFLTAQPVSYCLTGSRLYRYSDYGFSATQLLPERPNGGGCAAAACLPASTSAPEGRRVLISDQVDNSSLIGGVSGQAFDQEAASRQRNAVVQIDLNFNQDSERVRLNHEVLLQSTP
jgi:MSHA biogenesis protein MshO